MKKMFCCSASQKKMKGASNYSSPEKSQVASKEQSHISISSHSQTQIQDATPAKKVVQIKAGNDSTTEKNSDKNSSFSTTQISNFNQEGQPLEDTASVIERLRNSRKNPTILKEEQLIVEKLINSSQKKSYLVEINWALVYTNYLQGSQIQPTQIQNNLLLANPVNDLTKSVSLNSKNQQSCLKMGIKPSIEYVLLNEATWNFVHKLYGGGPKIYFKEEDEEGYNYSVIYEQDLHKYDSLKNLKKTALQPVGLANNRYYCYMNAAIQCLMSCNQMNYYIISEAKSFQENKGKSQLTSAYCDLLLYIQKLESQPNPILQISKIQNIVETKFDRNEQHDCHEFLIYFLSQILEESQVGKPQQRSFKDHKEALNFYCRQNQNFISQLFMGQMTSYIKCPRCNRVSEQYDPFFDLSLPVEPSVSKCLKKHFEDEVLEAGWCCDECRQKSDKIKRRILMTSTPNLLILHFKRFEMTRSYSNMRKLKDSIAIEMALDVSEFASKEVKSTKYQLQAAIVHSGSVEKGHYYALAKKENQWFKFDDDEVSEISASEVAKMSSAYVMFYSKII